QRRAVRAEVGEVKITKDAQVDAKPPDPGQPNPKGLLRRFTRHNEVVQALAVTRDGRLALSGGGGLFVDGVLNNGRDHSLLLWEIDTGNVKFRLRGHRSVVTSIAMLPDGKQALSSARDGELILWNLTTGQQRQLRYTGVVPLGAVECVSISKDGRY